MKCKVVFVAMLFGAYMRAIASAVAWNVVAVANDSWASYGVFGVFVRIPTTLFNSEIPDNWQFLVHEGNIYFGTSVSRKIATLSTCPNDINYLTSDPLALLPANPGDEASASTVLGRANEEYIFNDLIGYSDDSSYYERGTVSSVAGEIAYLIFAIQDQRRSWEWRDIHETGVEPDFTPAVYYGWASYTVDAQGNLTFIESAIGLNGQSMIVGVIPEPSCAALLLFETIALALRRPRK